MRQSLQIARHEAEPRDKDNTVLKQFDTDILLADITFKDAGTFDYEAVFRD